MTQIWDYSEKKNNAKWFEVGYFYYEKSGQDATTEICAKFRRRNDALDFAEIQAKNIVGVDAIVVR